MVNGREKVDGLTVGVKLGKTVRFDFLSTRVVIEPMYNEVEDEHLGHFLVEFAP